MTSITSTKGERRCIKDVFIAIVIIMPQEVIRCIVVRIVGNRLIG